MAESREEKDKSVDTGAKSERVLVVFCTYNEFSNLPQAVATIQKVAPHCDILVVDDNSPDGTGRWATEAASAERNSSEMSGAASKLHVINRSGKLGLGSALRDAIVWCLERQYDYLVNLDADLSHDPSKVPELLKVARDEQVDVVVGSRYVPGGETVGLSPFRRLLSRTLNRYAASKLGLPIRDCSGSYRCYRVSRLRELELRELTCDGYGFLEEILVALYRRGATLREIPITYHVRHSGQSKLSWSDATGALKVIRRLRMK